MPLGRATETTNLPCKNILFTLVGDAGVELFIRVWFVLTKATNSILMVFGGVEYRNLHELLWMNAISCLICTDLEVNISNASLATFHFQPYIIQKVSQSARAVPDTTASAHNFAIALCL